MPTNDRKVRNAKQSIEESLFHVGELVNSRERSMILTKLEEAELWLAKYDAVQTTLEEPSP